MKGRLKFNAKIALNSFSITLKECIFAGKAIKTNNSFTNQLL